VISDLAAPPPTTAAELESRPAGEDRLELVRGKVSELSPAGFEHGLIAAALLRMLGNFVSERGLGYVVSTETGFVLARDPDTVRAPDVAFVSAERVAATGLPVGFFDGAPDLAVEVVSPTDASEAVEAKVLDYLEAGSGEVWVVHPARRTVRIAGTRDRSRILRAGDTLDGGEILPGFAVQVEDLFPPSEAFGG